jgi:hypothetical protein
LFVFWYHSPNFLDTPRTSRRKIKITGLTCLQHGRSTGNESKMQENKVQFSGSVHNLWNCRYVQSTVLLRGHTNGRALKIKCQ